MIVGTSEAANLGARSLAQDTELGKRLAKAQGRTAF